MTGLKVAGRALVLAGAACVLAYLLVSLRGVSPRLVSLGGLLFYAGIASVVVGAALRASSKARRR